MLLGGEPIETGAQQQVLIQPERFHGLRGGKFHRPGRGQIHDRQFDVAGDPDLLNRAAFDEWVGGPQHLVPPKQLAEAAPQGGDVQRPQDPHGPVNVVSRVAGLELIEEPQPPLRGGERAGTGVPASGNDSRARDRPHPSLEQSPLLRGESGEPLLKITHGVDSR